MEVAFRVGDLGVDFAEALFVAKREEAEKNERQDVTLVIRRLDASAQGNGGVPEFPKEFPQSAVSVFLFVTGLGHRSLRGSLCCLLRSLRRGMRCRWRLIERSGGQHDRGIWSPRRCIADDFPQDAVNHRGSIGLDQAFNTLVRDAFQDNEIADDFDRESAGHVGLRRRLVLQLQNHLPASVVVLVRLGFNADLEVFRLNVDILLRVELAVRAKMQLGDKIVGEM